MSIESKYSIQLQPLSGRRQYRLVLAAIAMLIVFVSAPSLMWSVIIGLISLLVIPWWPVSFDDMPRTWLVDEAGVGHKLTAGQPEDSVLWQISARSKLFPCAIYLVLEHQHSLGCERCWVLPWQASDADFRRLARIVFRQGLQ